MHLYTAYGLGISSEFVFPELELAEKAQDVVIRSGKLSSSVRGAIHEETSFLGEIPGVGTFLIREGEEIIVDPASGADEALLRTNILGPALAVLLRQRGLFVLHASSIVGYGGVVAFLGGSGWGKSTLVDTLYSRGYSIIADDITAIHVGTDSPFLVAPAYPSIKLWPDAAEHLGYAGEELPVLHPQTKKRIHYVPRGFPRTSLPLRRMHVLALGTRNESEPLSPQAAFVELVRHSRAVGLLKSPASIQMHFQQCARLVKEVPIRRLTRQASLSGLAEVVQLVEEDLASHRSADGRMLSL